MCYIYREVEVGGRKKSIPLLPQTIFIPPRPPLTFTNFIMVVLNIKKIKLTKNKETWVDDKNYHFLNQWKWYAQKSKDKYYAARRDEKNKMILMHRLISGAKKGEVVDHVNNNSLCNLKNNLRKTTQRGNMQNLRNFTSTFPGVYLKKQTGKWGARIQKKYKELHLGYFDDELDAFFEYFKKCIELGQPCSVVIHDEVYDFNIVGVD